MKKIIIISSSLVLIVLISLILYSNKNTIDAAKISTPTNPHGVPVTTAIVKTISTDNTLILTGTTIPIRETQIAASTGGEITEIRFSLGTFVSSGSVLAKIDDKMKNLAFENANITTNKYETDYNKMKNMYDKNAGTENQLREIKYAYDNSVNRTKQAKRELEYTQIKAPFGGMVTAKLVELGTYVSPGTPICKITDVSGLKISINVSERDAYLLSVGKKAKITCSIFPDNVYSGSIIYVSPIADKGHNYTIEISINNSKDNKLKAGTFVKAVIELENKRTPLMIPKSVLIGSINDAKAYIISNGTALLKNIKIGVEYGQMIEVVDGLKEGDEVVTGGQLNLDNNTKVKVINN
jgi:RND family efflux transporter MFP subunit